jgi:hypothetical protein
MTETVAAWAMHTSRAVWRKRPSHRHPPTKANFSRLSCPYLRAIFGRHHPLNHSANETSRIRTSVKLRQKAATNLSQFVAFCRRHLPPSAEGFYHTDALLLG